MDTPLLETMALGGSGPSFAIKDSIDVAGYPSRLGSRALEGAGPAQRHAAVVEAILAAGGRIAAKAKMHELAYGVTGVNAWSGTPLNPDFPNLIPGGSSSGSAAAVAAGLTDLALGSDTGGSIRVPAACCGVFGLKPTQGRVSRVGVAPAQTELDCVGPFAGTIQGLRAAMAMIDPTFDAHALAGEPILGQVVVNAEPGVLSTVAKALAESGLGVRSLELEGLAAAFDAGIVLMAGEAWSAYGQFVDDDRLGADVAARLRRAATVTAAQLDQARTVRAMFIAQVDRALRHLDVLVLPTLPVFPLALEAAGDAAAALAITALVRPFNVSGHPALSIPLRSAEGPPVGLQIIGRKGEDARVCAIGELIAGRAADVILHTTQREFS